MNTYISYIITWEEEGIRKHCSNLYVDPFQYYIKGFFPKIFPFRLLGF